MKTNTTIDSYASDMWAKPNNNVTIIKLFEKYIKYVTVSVCYWLRFILPHRLTGYIKI